VAEWIDQLTDCCDDGGSGQGGVITGQCNICNNCWGTVDYYDYYLFIIKKNKVSILNWIEFAPEIGWYTSFLFSDWFGGFRGRVRGWTDRKR